MTTLVTLRRRLAADVQPDALADLLVGLLARTPRRHASPVADALRRGALGSACYGLGWLASALELEGRRDEAFLARLLADVLALRSIRPGYRRHRYLETSYRRALARRIDDLQPARTRQKAK